MRCCFIVLAACAAMSAAGAPVKTAKPIDPRLKLTPEEYSIVMQNKTGGVVSKPVEGNVVKIVDAAGLPSPVVSEVVKNFEAATRLPVVVEKGDDDIRGAKNGNVGFALVVTAKGGDTPKILAATEDGWAKVDIAWLKTSDETLYAKRLQQGLWRGLVYGLGGGNTKFPQCIMKPVMTLAEMDANMAVMACPDAYAPMVAAAAKYGINPRRTTTYLNACREGWAPAPTNDAQRIIYEKMKIWRADKADPTARWKRDFQENK